MGDAWEWGWADRDIHGDWLLELAALLYLEHEVAAVDVLHDKVETVHRLEAGMQLDEEWRLAGQCQDVFLHQSAFNVVVLDNDILLEDFDGVELVSSLALGQHHLEEKNKTKKKGDKEDCLRYSRLSPDERWRI